MASVTTWKGLSQKNILLCNMEKIYNTKNKLWVILYQDIETNHYLVEENCMKIIRKINQNEINLKNLIVTTQKFQNIKERNEDTNWNTLLNIFNNMGDAQIRTP